METKIIFDEARTNLINFFNSEFKNFDTLLLSNFLNRCNDFLNYQEENLKFKPKFIFTNNIDQLLKSINDTYMLSIYEDDTASNFNQRLKPIIALASSDWSIYIELKDNKVTYGLCKSLNSIKDKDILTLIENDKTIREKSDKLSCIIVRCINFYMMSLTSIKGNKLTINFSLDSSKQFNDNNDISKFVDDTFSKLRTTHNKLTDIKSMYTNIFQKVINEVNGAICVIVDKEYKDTGLFEDGIWLKEPISFNKLFTNSKSYSEAKLQAFVHLFISMLQFDGITIVDNFGRIRGYNIFIQTDSKKNRAIVGGARKRAAYTILNSRRKHIIGVYFQSHEGEIFYKSLHDKTKSVKSPIEIVETKPEQKPMTISPKIDDKIEIKSDNKTDNVLEKIENMNETKSNSIITTIIENKEESKQ